jgi:hypothetical protein
MRVLCLDLGTRTGWASFIGPDVKSGFENFAPHPGENRGCRYIRFNVWLYSWKTQKLEDVVIERPIPFHNNRQAAEIAFGLSTRVEEFCARHDVRLHLVNNATLKKWATGDGRASKSDMLTFARAVSHRQIIDDNEADAVVLLDHAVKVVLKDL